MKQIDLVRLRRILAVGIFIGSIVPVILLACGSIRHVKAVSVKEMEGTAQRLVELGAKDIGTFLQGKIALLSTLIRLHPTEYLRDSKNLATLFQAVNDNGRDGDIVALELVDIGGRQLAHAGPDHREDSGANYRDTEWFKQVLVGGVAVSDVFTDHRANPHFVIALTDPLKTCVLLSTVNSLVLNTMLQSVRIDPNSQAYIFSANGVLQTPDLRQEVHLNAIENSLLKQHNKKVQVATDKEFLYASQWLDGKNWILVLKTHFDDSLGAYSTYRTLTIGVVLVISAFLLLFSIITSRIIIGWIEIRDQRQKRAHNQLVHVEKRANIGRIAAGIVKDINEPLQQIQKQASTVENLAHQEERQHINPCTTDQDVLDKIQFHAQRIRTILDRLSCFSRKIDSEYNIQVNWVLREFLSFYEKEAQDRDITFNLQFDEHLPTIRTDGSQVQQLLLKLIENALDAVGVAGHIDIITYNKSGEVHVQIADSGPGITCERMERLWQPFPVARGTDKGVWFDLSMYSNIVYQLGGSLSAKDRPQGWHAGNP